MTPSTLPVSDNDQISKYLQIPDFKKLYTDHLKLVKKANNKFSTCEFLRNCLLNDVIPKTFRIKNKPANFGSTEFQQLWHAESKEQSRRWIQNSIDDMNDQCLLLFKERDKVKANLILKTSTVDRIALQEHLLKQEKKILCQALKMKNNKFKHLKLQQNETIIAPREPDIAEERNDIRVRRKKKNRPGTRERKYRAKVLKKIQKKTPVNIVFNYSSIELSEAAISALNRGLNFCIKPSKVDNTEIIADHSRFSRRMQWQEHFFGEEKQDYTPSIFKQEKTNFPNQSLVPKPLQVFLNTVESNLQNRENWNKKHLNPEIKNLPQIELEALKNLAQLQKERRICIKPADKGSGIVIVDYDDYINSCNQHLQSNQTQQNGQNLPYYKISSTRELEEMKKSISNVLKNGLDKEYISRSEFKAMDPSEKGPGRFYHIFKVHKEHAPGTVPPGRPIVSGNGSITENISRFVDLHAKQVIHRIESHIEDTPHFLRTIEAHNQSKNIKNTDILVTLDVSSLYTNIRHEDGMDAMKRSLEYRTDKTVPTDFLIKLLQLVLTCNAFEFGKSLFLQCLGTAMGTCCAPNYATIMMNDLDIKIRNLAKEMMTAEDPIVLLKRFLDDLFMIWRGKVEDLEAFLEQINNLHPTIKFTSSYTCPFPCTINVKHDCFCYSSRSIPFLDTLVTIKDNILVTDIYRKPTDRCQYLLPSSSHPAHITTNIPFSLCYRLVRICSEKTTLKTRMEELKQLLLTRQYNEKIINGAMLKALNIDRNEALKKKIKTPTTRIPFVITYHPALPSINTILRQGWKTMTKDEHLKKVFPEPPMVAYRQPKNSSIRQMLVKSKLPEREQRVVNGMKKCNQPGCNTCPHIKESKIVNSTANNFKVTISTPANCTTKNLVYAITCDRQGCRNNQYIGETMKQLKERFSQHLSAVRSTNENIKQTAVGEHFNLPGHSTANMKVTVLEKCRQNSSLYRKARESFFINKFETKRLGLNKKM